MITRFWLFHCAYARVPREAIIQGGGWDLVRLPMLCGVAEHSELGPILLDAPYGHEGPSNVGSLMGSLMRRTGLEFQERWSVVARLEELGLRAADVGHILMTHLHYDHTGGMKSLAHARFHISQEEWDFAHSGSNRRSSMRGYARTDFMSLRNRVELRDPVPHLLDGTAGLDLFGDGSIEMFFLPGHTPGHCGFRLHLAEGPPILFVGDAAFTVPQIRGAENMGFALRTIASSMGGVRTSLRAIRRHIERHPEDRLITCHDFELGARCIKEGPIFFS